MKTLIQIIGFVLLIDFIGFCAWILSNQVPVDNFHVGIITELIIKVFI